MALVILVTPESYGNSDYVVQIVPLRVRFGSPPRPRHCFAPGERGKYPDLSVHGVLNRICCLGSVFQSPLLICRDGQSSGRIDVRFSLESTNVFVGFAPHAPLQFCRTLCFMAFDGLMCLLFAFSSTACCGHEPMPMYMHLHVRYRI